MHTNTKNKIEFLQQHIKRNLSRWYKKYGENVTGVRVDKKRKGKNTKNYYSIVFNVVKKEKEEDIPKGKAIPKHINVTFKDGNAKKIKTDVRQTGEFKFQSRIMDTVRDGQTGNPGTLGLLLQDQRDNVFGLTNYHVAAEQLLQNRIFSYNVTNGDLRHDVAVGGSICRLHIGTFNQNLDVALIYLGSQLPVNNNLPDGRRVNNTTFIDGPLPVTVRNKIVSLYLPSRNGRISEPIEDNQAPLKHRLMRFIELVTVNRCSRGGDSGSLVLGDNNMVLGIVLGADDDFTYIIPYYKIFNFFPLNIL